MQVVAPHIGFCVKSSVDSHGLQSVVYLNLLYHKDVPEAVARPGAVLHDEPCTGHCNHDDSRWEISYVLGPPRSHRAKDGSLRSIYDFVFGVKTLRRAQSDEQFRLVLLQTCYRALQEKINTSLSKKFNIAKKYAFKGPPEHPKTLVTELTSQPCVEAKESAHTASNSPLTAADYTIARSAASDVGVFDYHVRISLPKLDTAADSSLHLTRSAVTFFAPGRYDLKIELGAHVTVDVASGSSVFDQISRVMHVRFRVTEGTQTGMQASNTEPVAHLQDSHGHSHAHDTTKHTEQADYTHALVAPPPFAPQMLELRSAGGTRFPCFCRQTIRSVTLVITTGVISGLELVLYRAVKPKTTSSISDANAVVVLEKVTPEFWPSLAPPLPAKTSSSLQF